MALKSTRTSLDLLKNGVNEADTGSVVHEVRGHRAVTNAGRTTAPTAAGKRSNDMTSANANPGKRR